MKRLIFLYVVLAAVAVACGTAGAKRENETGHWRAFHSFHKEPY